MAPISLVILIHGDNHGRDNFRVHIDNNATVMDLKQVIFEKVESRFGSYNPTDLILWAINIPFRERSKLTNLSLEEADSLIQADYVSSYYKGNVLPTCFNIIVKLPPRESMVF